MTNFLDRMPQVAVMLPPSVKVCRDMRQGVFRYARLHGPWSIHLIEDRSEPQRLSSSPGLYSGLIGMPMTAEEVKFLQDKVNEVISQKIPVVCEEKTLAEAEAEGAMCLFKDKYNAQNVKVYTIGNVSKEVCGGPHAKNTGDLGHFRILKEESSSAGVRRIKAVLE